MLPLRSTSNLVGNSSSNPTTSNPKRRNRRRSNQRVEPFALEESPVVTMADQRTMAELLRAPTEGYAGNRWFHQFMSEHSSSSKVSLTMMNFDHFFVPEKDNPPTTSFGFNKITSTIKYKDVPNHAIKLMLFPFSLAGAARRWLEKEPPRSINGFFPPSRTTNLRNEISNFQQKFDESFHEAWDRYKDLLHACPHHVRNSRNKSVVSQVKSSDGNSSSSSDIAKLTHAVNQQTSAVTTAMTAILKQFQATPPPASVKAVEEICVTCGGPHPYYQCLAADGNTFPEYRDNIQGYVAAAAGNYNQGNAGYRPPGVVNQTRPPGFVQQNGQNNQNRFSQPQGYNRGNNFNQNANYQAPIQQNQSVPLSELEKIKKMNDVNMKAMQAQINNVKNELRNEMQSSIQASMSNQTNELKNMMASFFQMNTASTSGSGSLPSNTVANPKGELKAITTRSGLVLDGPTVLMPPPFINPEEDERVEETLTDPEHGEYTIKVPPPQVQKAKPPSQRNFVIHQRDPRYPHIPYPSRMNQEKQKEKDEVQIHKFWQMFKQLHINISLADALILILKYQKMLKSLLSNKEKLIELANTPLNENCSAVILKKLPEKLGDPRKFLIPCGFSELKCKALADLGASINLMPLSIWKKLGLPEHISTQMTLELANRDICTPKGIARDVFVPVGKFTFLADFVIVDYESDPCVSLILGRPFLRTARALIDVHGKEMILRDDLPPYHDNQLSGNPTPISEPETMSSSSSPILISLEKDDYDDNLFDLETVNDNPYDDPFDSKEEKIKESKLLIDELDLPGSSDFLPFPECDSVFYENFSEVDALPSTNNEDKNVKKTTNASLILEDFNPPLYELPFHKEVPGLGALLSFSSENEEKVFNPGILTSKRVQTSLLPELSHRSPKTFKVTKILESPMEIFPCSYQEDIRVLDVPCLHFYPP
ncbi:reverse transcriptase domain-containing protein [Tanacetum coccineum]